MNWLEKLFEAQLTIGSQHILWREVVGNLFGFASAIGGLRRRVWAWPVGIVGNALLFTVFFGVAFSNPQHTTLFGQAGRQIFFIITSVYGWWRWNAVRRANHAEGTDRPAITPRWATVRERLGYLAFWVGGVVVLQAVFALIGAGWPAPRWYYWCDAWIFVGSIVATYAMARGWNDFWLAWIAVDLVGVPLLVNSKFYPSAVLYAVYGGLVVYGFFVWLKASREERLPEPQREEVHA
ncbi:nicotinamide mononucleotide transporter family protein [Nostocoides sp. HKS02]|uniref:nicotinamide mononucleotide transporter family protein n=1 Tax=Nostocoides sp. HKS02 TaxID=1813880 RepID=UPI0012B47F24|nr:nicotinamide mononucleotide transporter family protein [Tetrasphaera sp. HKS02]QGN57115.1 nicotinamide riboside transporter PnuC [Tetrasphaera sp. HKS02]